MDSATQVHRSRFAGVVRERSFEQCALDRGAAISNTGPDPKAEPAFRGVRFHDARESCQAI